MSSQQPVLLLGHGSGGDVLLAEDRSRVAGDDIRRTLDIRDVGVLKLEEGQALKQGDILIAMGTREQLSVLEETCERCKTDD